MHCYYYVVDEVGCRGAWLVLPSLTLQHVFLGGRASSNSRQHSVGILQYCTYAVLLLLALVSEFYAGNDDVMTRDDERVRGDLVHSITSVTS